MNKTKFGIEFELFGPKGYTSDMTSGLITHLGKSNNLKIRCLYYRDDDYDDDHRDGYERYTPKGRKVINPKWNITNDCSLYSEKFQGEGLEVVSPILSGVKGQAEIGRMLTLLNKIKCSVNDTSGLHIHVSSSGMTNMEIFSVILRYQIFLNKIEKFFSHHRRGDGEYAHSQSVQALEEMFCAVKELPMSKDIDLYTDKYSHVGIHDCYTTLEFRQHEGCIDKKKVLTWAAFCINFVDQTKVIIRDINLKEIKSLEDFKNFLRAYPPELGLSSSKAKQFAHFQRTRSKN